MAFLRRRGNFTEGHRVAGFCGLSFPIHGDDQAVIRLLQFGTSGQVARAMIAAAEGRVRLTALSRADCDLEQPGAVARALSNSPQPDIVVNAAAYTAVDKAERDASMAFRI